MYKSKQSLLSIGIAISLAATGTQAYAENLKIEAEAFNNSGGTYNDNQPNRVTIYSVNGKQGINYINAGDYVDYEINAIGGEYTIEYLVGTAIAANPTIEVLVNNNGTFASQGSVVVPLGSWDNFQPLTAAHKVTLPAGTSTLRLLAVGPTWQWNLESFTLTGGTAPGNGGGGGSTEPVENIVVNLENFASTNKDSAAISGDSYVGFHATNTGINFNTSGDYADYNVIFTKAGTYSATLAAGSPITGQLGAEVIIDNYAVATAYLSATGGWDNYSNFDLNGDIVIPTPGTYSVRLKSHGSATWQWNADTLTFIHQSNDTGSSDIGVTGVSVSPATASLVVGQTQTATASVMPTNATNTAVTFSSSHAAIASVNANGLITAQSPGTATITVRTADGNFSAQTTVTVTAADILVTGVSITPTSASLTVGQTQTATASVIPANATNTAITFSSSHAAIASVGANGLITAKTAGTATITATSVDGNFKATTVVTVTNAGGGSGGSGGSGGGSGQPEDALPGLMRGEVSGAANWTDANPNWARTTTFAEIHDTIKGNTTEIYTGIFSDADGIISFYEHIDDSVRLTVAGSLVLSNDSWANSSQAVGVNIGAGDIAPGIYSFELRLGNADGGSGPVGTSIGFGIDVNGGTNFKKPAELGTNFFTSTGTENGDISIGNPNDVYIQLENFNATGTTGRVASDPNDGFVVGDTGTNVGWVTNGDYGDYNNIYLEAGTYSSFITVSTPETGSFGARIDINGETASWGYFDSTGGWSISEEVELYGGEFVIPTSGNYNLRVEAIGGSDWQWSGDAVRLAKKSSNTYKTPAIYNPADHYVAEVQGPATGLQYLKDPIQIPAANKLLKSDVWYTYPQNRDFYDAANGGQPGDYADFGATGSFWGHPPESNFYDDTVIMEWAVNVVDKYQSEGLEYTARGEFDWGYGWFTEYVTSSQDHYVQTLDDRNVRMTFMGYLSHNGHNNNWLSNHSPAFVPFMKSQVDQILKANPDKLMFDTQTNSTRSTDMRTFGGDFSPYAMENFRIWLDKKYSSAELTAMGINNINTFDYKQHLLNAGVTHTSFSNGADRLEGNIPMLEDFLYFNRDVWNQKFGEVLAYIRETHPNIEIGASTQLFESRGYIFNENITFLSGELNLGAKTSIATLPTNILVHLKGAQAINKPLAYAPYPWEFEELRVQNAPRFGRGWVAQAYAYGGLFSIPANVWVGGDVFTWSPGADNYRDIYQFVRAKESLFDNYTSYSKVAIVHAMYSSMKAGFIDGGDQIQSSVKLLTEDNINFDMLVFGDSGYPVVPRNEDFAKFDHIFYDGDYNYLTAEQKTVLNSQGSKVRHIGQRGTIANLAINVRINGTVSNKTVSAVSRIHETDSNAPYVVHLINRPFANGVTPTLNGVEVAIPASFFPQTVSSVTLHLPDGTSANLPVTSNANGDTVVTVNNLEVWGILELDH